MIFEDVKRFKYQLSEQLTIKVYNRTIKKGIICDGKKIKVGLQCKSLRLYGFSLGASSEGELILRLPRSTIKSNVAFGDYRDTMSDKIPRLMEAERQYYQQGNRLAFKSKSANIYFNEYVFEEKDILKSIVLPYNPLLVIIMIELN